MKIVFFSDTHRAHRSVNLPKADMHIFTGDCTGRGSRQDVTDFLNWFKDQDSKHKVMIAGNHDYFFEASPLEVPYIMPDNITYLEDSGCEIEGIKFWGSPMTPWFHNWAFNRTRNTTYDGDYKEHLVGSIKKHWDAIPDDTQILLTHGPSSKKLDLVMPKFRRHNESPHVGCIDLSNALDRVKPKIFAFGHIHETYGKDFDDNGTLHINSSIMNEDYEPINEPILIDWSEYTRNR